MKNTAPKFLLALPCMLVAAAAAVIASDYYEPFAGAAGEQPPAGWTALEAGENISSIDSGSLEFARMKAPEGNRFGFEMDSAEQVRGGFQSPAIGGLETGDVYYSFLFQIDDLGRLSEDGGHTGLIMLAVRDAGIKIGGEAYGAVALRRDGETGFRLGISSGHSGFQGGAVAADESLALGETVFVVVRYDHTSATASLWINPTPGEPEPAPSATAEPTRAVGRKIDCVFIGAQTSVTVVPSKFSIDEIRVGKSWEEVTPAQ